ncbi:hypothetical protein ACRE_040400 [Hapsidospora chrysogenum ATCC 11550]|uniref:Uncharacterized protein n=1 Tax=Hapsidospora chrysogenum (strain ATCC 11550 / CBS 779.69 / DSM 880 / IAM 14645 / JCM 23072 / IMI 49137) TaxID=857340 RepID=A0A086T732_HAPC1|nr:hypothetical protein ACRE_040400 [Hapsidospora chrysogenum ATCC 11550]
MDNSGHQLDTVRLPATATEDGRRDPSVPPGEDKTSRARACSTLSRPMGLFYLSTELVPGVSIAQLTEEQKQVVTNELLDHDATLKSLRSDTPGVPGQTLPCAPNRVHSRFEKHHT